MHSPPPSPSVYQSYPPPVRTRSDAGRASSKPTLYLLYIDAYHLEDLLFVESLARAVANAGSDRPRCMLVHGSGELAERLFEAQGLFPDRSEEGLWRVETATECALVERAARETNRKLVGALTDALVAAVGVHGGDRDLLRMDAGGDVEGGTMHWVGTLLSQEVLPVVSTLVHEPDTSHDCEVAGHDALAALAEGLAEYRVVSVFFVRGNQPGLVLGNAVLPDVGAGELASHTEALPEPALVGLTAEKGLPVLLTSVAAFFHEQGVRGTWVYTDPAGATQDV